MVTEEDVRYIAKLAHLEMQGEDVQKFTGQLNQILDYMNQLNELDDEINTQGVQPMMHATRGETLHLRKDVVKESLQQSEALENCVKVKEGAFVVPKVIES